jgi:hypothetical protein
MADEPDAFDEFVAETLKLYERPTTYEVARSMTNNASELLAISGRLNESIRRAGWERKDGYWVRGPRAAPKSVAPPKRNIVPIKPVDSEEPF